MSTYDKQVHCMNSPAPLEEYSLDNLYSYSKLSGANSTAAIAYKKKSLFYTLVLPSNLSSYAAGYSVPSMRSFVPMATAAFFIRSISGRAIRYSIAVLFSTSVWRPSFRSSLCHLRSVFGEWDCRAFFTRLESELGIT